MRTVAETGLTQTALAAAALKRSLCRRRRRTPSGRSPTRGSSSTRRVSLLADEEKLPWQENEVTIQGPWRPSASFGKTSGGEKALQQCWCSRHRAIHLFLPDWPRGRPAPADGAWAARIHSPPLSCPCLHCHCQPTTGGGQRVRGWYGVKEAVVPAVESKPQTELISACRPCVDHLLATC